MRLDRYLKEFCDIQSRTKAQELVKKGCVKVDGKTIAKPAFEVEEGMEVSLEEHKEYVSRAAWKLLHFLDENEDLQVSGKEALDIGSSTGGFSEVLLERDARSVVCVDVGKEQLHPKIRSNKRVEVHEQTDIREFVHPPFGLVVSDVSFISLLKILDAIERLSSDEIILLFKPQFEVGRHVKRDKKGVVQDQKAIALAMERFEAACREKKWRLIKKSPSKITGKDGNLEYCYRFKKS